MAANNGTSYQYDAESRLINYASGSGVYTYDAEGNRVQKQSGGTPTDYIYFGSQPIAEYNPALGDWSDYIYADGRRLASADTFEDGLEVSGTYSGQQIDGEGLIEWCGVPFASLPYTIKSGDSFIWRQYQNSVTRGGIYLLINGQATTWDTYDTNGQLTNSDNNTGYWDARTFDLSAFAGEQLQAINIGADQDTQAGSWDIVFDDMVIVSADGTIHTIYARQSGWSLSCSGNNNATETNRHLSNVGTYPQTTTLYYHSDHLGSARLMSTYYGVPLWSGTFLPFGEERNPQLTTNHYKFTGKERDSESGLDNFGARYFSSQFGRFMSPDPLGGHLENPQSLNKYAYALNNPSASLIRPAWIPT